MILLGIPPCELTQVISLIADRPNKYKPVDCDISPNMRYTLLTGRKGALVSRLPGNKAKASDNGVARVLALGTRI